MKKLIVLLLAVALVIGIAEAQGPQATREQQLVYENLTLSKRVLVLQDQVAAQNAAVDRLVKIIQDHGDEGLLKKLAEAGFQFAQKDTTTQITVEEK